MDTAKKTKAAYRLYDAAMNMASTVSSKNRIEEITIHCEGFAEPGYDGDVIASGNWNDITEYKNNSRQTVSTIPSRLAKAFERIGVEVVWSDEWTECCDCGKLIRTEPDSYGWTLSAQFVDGEGYRCIDCLEEDPAEYLSSLEGNSDTANTIDSIDPCDHGYVKVNEDSYASGWHPGQNDDPRKVAKELEKKGISRYLFGIDSVGQFDAHWSVYVHQEEEHLLNPAESENPTCDDMRHGCDNNCDECCPSVVVETPKKEVPCKCCKTTLWENESPCWKCGTDNPTV